MAAVKELLRAEADGALGFWRLYSEQQDKTGRI